MYNRYIPQSDGSYRRQQFAEKTVRTPHPSPPPPEPEIPCCPPPEPERPCGSCTGCRKHPPRKEPPEQGCGSFLRALLPGDFDTEDLLVVVLLLLMSGDSREGGNLPLLTLALYLFL